MPMKITRKPGTPRVSNRLVALALLAGSLGACRVGDVGGNVVRNALGGNALGNVVAAGFQSALEAPSWQP